MRECWRKLSDDFFVNYVLTVVKKRYFGSDYFLYICKLFDRLVSACGGGYVNPKVLDAGSGSGLPDFYLERKGAETYLLDCSKEVIKNSRKHQFLLKSTNVHYVLADIRTLPFREGALDIVWNEGVIEHFNDDERDQILDEMKRVTKHKGLVVIMTPNLFTPHALGIKQFRRLIKKFPQDRWGRERAYSPNQLGELLTNLRLKDIHVGSCDLPRTVLDDFAMSCLHRTKISDRIRIALIEVEEWIGDFGCGFISGAIGTVR